MSDLGRQDDPIFKGRTPGGISCDEFVRAVRKHAMVEKKARDDEYIADYAMSCLSAEALEWSENLSKDVQGDWSLLRRALLAEYGVDKQHTGATFSSALIPIPAAAPAFQPTASSPFPSVAIAPVLPTNTVTWTSIADTRRGRIRVEMGSALYYIMISENVPARCVTTQDIQNAATVEVIDAIGTVELRFMTPGSKSGSWLGMVWEPKVVQDGSYAALLPVERHGINVLNPRGTSGPAWKGAVSVVKWRRSASGVLAPILGSKEGTFVVSNPNDEGLIDITNNVVTCPLFGWKEAQLIFQPL